MKLNISIPSHKHLQSAYNVLQGAPSADTDRLAKFVQMSRFDARLFEILAMYFAKNYVTTNPFSFNVILLQLDWGVAIGPILNHSRILIKDLPAFDHWCKIVTMGLSPAQGELFFLGAFDLNPKRIAKIIARPSRLFKVWGFYHDEIVLNKAESINRTVMLKSERLRLLKKLLRSKEIISVNDYRRALNFQVSVRQAQRDLKLFKADIFRLNP